MQYPAGWKRSERDGIYNLESPDRCVVIALSAPAAASTAGRLFDDTIAGLRRNFGKLRTRPPTREADIGNAPTETRLIAVRTKAGQSVVIQVSVSKGQELAHVAQVVIRDPGCAASIQQSGVVVGSIEYRR